MMIRLRILFLAMLCAATSMLHAQSVDTPPQTGTVRCDTLFVHDTLHARDTVSIDEYIRKQTFEQLFGGPKYTDIQHFPIP